LKILQFQLTHSIA